MIWSRWSAAGNTFYIADEWTRPWVPRQQRSTIASSLCRAFSRAPTDGVIFLEKTSGSDFQWDFYNSDGSSAEMCGNAARCAAHYFRELIENKNKISFITRAGEVQVVIDGPDKATVLMPPLGSSFQRIEDLFHINTGVPHFVLEEVPTTTAARQLRSLPAPAGSNVTFIYAIEKDSCRAVSFERGVEDFTEACGTGAVAAAAYFNQKYGIGKVKVHMPGGILEVDHALPGLRPQLFGEVHHCYDLNTRSERLGVHLESV